MSYCSSGKQGPRDTAVSDTRPSAASEGMRLNLKRFHASWPPLGCHAGRNHEGMNSFLRSATNAAPDVVDAMLLCTIKTVSNHFRGFTNF